MTDTVHDQQTFPFGFTGISDDRTSNDTFVRRDAATPAAVVAPTAVLELPTELTEEERKLAAERAARREARKAALAAADVRTAPEAVVVSRRGIDGFSGAFSLLLVRLVVAAIMAVHGLAFVTDPVAAQQLFATTILPEPAIMAAVTGYASLAIAVALLFGLLTRAAGFGVLLIAVGALTFVLWGDGRPFIASRAGFVGELELLLAAVGLLLLCIGGGRFSLDRGFRRSGANRTS